jgi:tetratricopeptide (TPR) repeat protein
VRRPAFARWLALALVALPLPGVAALAQEVVAAANPDADRLADVVRRLGSAPRDLSALIEAGDLSFALGDATAAAAFYKRGESIDPNNGRIKAGIARILVNGERPGEALRFFEQAQRHGAPMAQYADDRGLAYDLIGEQARAQQDYRLALSQGGRDAAELDEVRRRYALSLGISGRQEQALAEIDALLRKSDRGAWRARAFILAMNGDVSGANKIASSMMPRGMAGGLAAFFQRLPTLSPVDRAFAVHFGEVAPTAARLADARMVPPLTPLAVAPAPVQVAAAPAIPPVPQKRLSRSEQRKRDRAAQLAAANTRAPMPTPMPAPSNAQPLPTSTPTPLPQMVQTVPAAPVRAPAVAQVAQATPAPQMVQAVPTPRPAPAPVREPVPAQVVQATPVPATPVRSTPTAPQLASAVTTAPTPRAARRITPPPLRAVPRISEDSILARIVAGISVPAAELGVRPMPGAQRVPVVAPPAPSPATLEEAAQTAERNAAADEQKRPRLAAAKRVAQKAPVVEEAEERPLAKPLDRKARAKELAAEKAKKEAAAKEAAEKKAARAEPERIWVQVASGANADDLPKAWKGAQGKADALAEKRAYSVSNRATNRLVTGPFKTEAEARAMVNTLKKQGLSAFTFTSEAGQKMTRLGGK